MSYDDVAPFQPRGTHRGRSTAPSRDRPHPRKPPSSGGFFTHLRSRFPTGRSNLHPQPAARKPASMLGVWSRTFTRAAEKDRDREARNAPKSCRSAGSRSRGQPRKPRQYWRFGQKKSQPIRVGILFIGGGGGSRTPVRKPYVSCSTCLAGSWFSLRRAPTGGKAAQPAWWF